MNINRSYLHSGTVIANLSACLPLINEQKPAELQACLLKQKLKKKGWYKRTMEISKAQQTHYLKWQKEDLSWEMVKDACIHPNYMLKIKSRRRVYTN